MLEQFCSILLTEFKVLPHFPSACKLTVVIIASVRSAGTRDISNTLSFHLKVIFIFSTHLKLHMTMSCRCESCTEADRRVHTHKARYQFLECPEEFTYLSWHIKCSAGEISLVITTPILVHRILTSLISVAILKKNKKSCLILLNIAEITGTGITTHIKTAESNGYLRFVKLPWVTVYGHSRSEDKQDKNVNMALCDVQIHLVLEFCEELGSWNWLLFRK